LFCSDRIEEYFGDRLKEKRDVVETLVFSTDLDLDMRNLRFGGRPLRFADAFFPNVKNIEFHNVSFIMASFKDDGNPWNKWFFRREVCVKFVNCSFVEEMKVSAHNPDAFYGETCFDFYALLCTYGPVITFQNTGEELQSFLFFSK
jgi:hypothetical protein